MEQKTEVTVVEEVKVGFIKKNWKKIATGVAIIGGVAAGAVIALKLSNKGGAVLDTVQTLGEAAATTTEAAAETIGSIQ